MYYLYRHIRLDKNEPFYIGVGTKPKSSDYVSVEFYRAYNKSSRNNIWRKIASKTGYEVEIMLESDDYEFIKQKEIEFIKLYGRIDLTTGTLANLTDGGEGTVGIKVSQETRDKISKNSFSKGKFGKDSPSSKKVYQYDLDGNFIREWDSLVDINRSLGSKVHVKGKTFKGFMWRYEFLGNKIEPVNYDKGIKNRLDATCVPIYLYNNNGHLLRYFTSLSEASRKTGFPITSIQQAANRQNNTYRGYIWTTEPITN